MSYVVANGSVVTAEGILPGARLSLHGDRIATLDRPAAHERVDLDLDGGWLVPGFIDTQVLSLIHIWMCIRDSAWRVEDKGRL